MTDNNCGAYENEYYDTQRLGLVSGLFFFLRLEDVDNASLPM